MLTMQKKLQNGRAEETYNRESSFPAIKRMFATASLFSKYKIKQIREKDANKKTQNSKSRKKKQLLWFRLIQIYLQK